MDRAYIRAAVVSAAVLLHATVLMPSSAQEQEGRTPAPQETPAEQGARPQPDVLTPGDGQQAPTFRGAIDLVRVDVFVTGRNGEPVMDLDVSEFEVLEDGKRRPIEQLRAIRIDGTTPAPVETRLPTRIRDTFDEQDAASEEDARVFVFFLDDYHTRDTNAMTVRKPLIEFIRTHARPADLLAVMYPLTPVMDLSFTRNHDVIISALENFEGRKYDYTPRNAMERSYSDQSADVIEQLRNQVVAGALEGLALRLSGVREERKTVVFVSEGFITLLPPEMRLNNSREQFRQLGGAQSDPRMEAMEELQRQSWLELRLREIYRAANRSNTSIYSLDPRGLTPNEFQLGDGGVAGQPSMTADRQALQSTQDTLRLLSNETDGRAILNRNTLLDGLAQMARDASYYYLIGYVTESPADGKFHEIRVRVTRPGVTVRARRGYWALSPADIKQMTAPRRTVAPTAVQQALASIATQVQAARWVRTWVGTERGENGRTRVTLTWEPLPAQVDLRREQAGQISLLAAGADGGLVYRGRSPDADASDAQPANGPGRGGTPAPAAASAPRRIAFDAPPGELELRMTIAGADGGTLDTETRTIAVPDLTGSQVMLSTPRVFRSRTARDFQQFAGDAAAVPVAARDFSRAERLLIRFDVYAPGSDAPTPDAALLSRTGEKMSDVTVAPAKAGGTHQIDLNLNSLSAGEYVVEITVTDAAGQTATELVPLRVGA